MYNLIIGKDCLEDSEGVLMENDNEYMHEMIAISYMSSLT